MKTIMAAMVVGALAVGCGQQSQTATEPGAAGSNPPPARSTVSDAIDGFTGKYAVDAGQRAKAKIQAIDKQRQKDIEEAAK